MAFYFKKIPELDVEPQVRERARAMLDFCQKKLGLTGIKIVWIKKAKEVEFKINSALVQIEANLRRLLNDRSDIETSFGENAVELWGLFQYGLFKKDNILIRYDIDEREILLTVAHECQHRRDDEDYRPAWTDQEKAIWERRAETFALAAVKEFESAGGRG